MTTEFLDGRRLGLRLIRSAFGPVLLACLTQTGGRGVEAQSGDLASVVGTAIAQDTGFPVPGVFVTLVDSAGSRVAGAIAGTNGRFILRGPAGVYRLRGERIGIDGTLSDPFTLAPGQVLAREFVLGMAVISLEGVSVTGEQRCDLRGDAGRTVAVWEEARKALDLASWSNEMGLYDYTSELWERHYDSSARRVVSESRDTVSRAGQQAFRSLSADSLELFGFVIGDDSDRYYYAPDAAVLLSDPFLRTHCFRTTRDGDRLGLQFEPVPGREIADVEGTIWLDESGLLDRLEFEYTNLSGLVASSRTLGDQLRAVRLGGRVQFEGLESGGWIVREWNIRMPTVAIEVDASGDTRRRFLDGIVEVGGEVLVAQPQGEASNRIVYSPRVGAVRGMVRDTSGVNGLKGALVYLSGAGSSTTTAADGSFLLEGVRPGIYSLVVEHPIRTELGVPAPSTGVQVVAGEIIDSGELRFPHRASVLAARCEGRPLVEIEAPYSRSGEPAMVGGVLLDKNRLPVPRGRVRVRWNAVAFDGGGAAERWLGIEVPADERGAWVVCGVPTDVRIEVETYNADGDVQRPFRVGLVGPGSRIWVTVLREGGEAD